MAKRRDWFRILRDLKKAGVSYHDVARKCGRASVTTVCNWAEGGEPRDSDAQTVLAIYARRCPVEYQAHMVEHGGVGARFEETLERGESGSLPFVG